MCSADAGRRRAWAESSTWESREGWTQSSGGVANVYWFGVHTPGDASTLYSFTSIQLMQQNDNRGNNCYLAIARTNATNTLNTDYVIAVSDNAVTPSHSSTGALETYNFASGVQLLGGTTYYFVFLSSNVPSDGAYTVAQGRISLNHNGYTDNYPYGNSNGEAKWWPYYTATVESSTATGFCTGDVLGGTSASGNWVASWTSGTDPSFTMTSNANNINNASNKPAGGLDIRSGQAKTATYTFTAPTGYVITGYKLFGKALNGNQTVTPAEGGSAVVFNSAGNSIKVSGLRKASTSFTLAGENNGLLLHAMQVELEPLTSITTLPTANNKAYVIANARATFNFADNATGMSVVTPVNTNLNAQSQQIALIYKNENYYLFSVNAGKYLTASNKLTSMPTDAEQISITSTSNASYPWFFSFKNVADKNINVTETPSLTIDDWSTIDDGNSNAIVEAADFDATDALAMFNTRTVTYNLSYGGNSTFRTVSDVTVTLSAPASDFVPSDFVKAGVTLTYSPETISSETTEVNVTATWNGPFNIASSYDAATQNIWYVVDMHSSENDYTWQYDDTSKEIQTPVIAKDAYGSLTDANLWCFVGNPWDGFKIYNKAAGSTMTIRKENTGNTVSYMSETDDHNLFKLYEATTAKRSITDPYCFKLDGDDYYLNKQNLKLQGWTDTDEGSACRFLAPGTYHLAAMNSWNIDAHLGAVGTKSYIATESQRTSMIEARNNIAADPFSVVGYFDDMNTILNPIRDSETIALTDGYYRFVNAYTAWTSTRPTTYYNSTANRIEWSVASNASDNVNSIFKVDATTPSIFSPNAQKYMSVVNSTVSGSLAYEPGTTVFTSLGSAQYNVVIGGGTMHTAGHNSGAGTSGNLTHWNGTANTASAWYIVPVESLSITLNDGGDGNYYATLCLPFEVTLDGCKAYTLTLNSAKTALTLSDAMTKVLAGTPVLLKGTDASATANIAASAASGAPVTNTALTGTYTDLSVNSGDYFLGKDDSAVGFYHWDGTSLKANRAYLEGSKITAGVKGLLIDFSTPTAITELFQRQQATQIYDLGGRRVKATARGLYLVNGKKVIVK